MALYCPRCDKRIEPDHRCLSRRFFLGMLGAAGAAAVLPKPPSPPPVLVARASKRVIAVWEDFPQVILYADMRQGRWIIDPIAAGEYETGILHVVDEPKQS